MLKLDNLIQVGHNVEIGENTVTAALTGISGSTIIGKNCMIGGQVGFAGHTTVADRVIIAGKSGVSKNIVDSDIILQGNPTVPIMDYRKSNVYFRKLPKLATEVEMLKKEIKELKSLYKA